MIFTFYHDVQEGANLIPSNSRDWIRFLTSPCTWDEKPCFVDVSPGGEPITAVRSLSSSETVPTTDSAVSLTEHQLPKHGCLKIHFYVVCKLANSNPNERESEEEDNVLQMTAFWMGSEAWSHRDFH